MNLGALRRPASISRTKVGLSVLAVVLTALTAGQVAAAQFDAQLPSIQVASQ
jgi:hypothetical protein